MIEGVDFIKKYNEIVNEEDFDINWDCKIGYMEALHIPTGKKKRISLNENSNIVQAARQLQYWIVVHLEEI